MNCKPTIHCRISTATAVHCHCYLLPLLSTLPLATATDTAIHTLPLPLLFIHCHCHCHCYSSTATATSTSTATSTATPSCLSRDRPLYLFEPVYRCRDPEPRGGDRRGQAAAGAQAGAPHRCVWGTEEWQWLIGSGAVGKRRSARFEWCKLERVAVDIGGGSGGGSGGHQLCFFFSVSSGSSTSVRVGDKGVAVAVWQWCHWIAGSNAVRTV
jgi:hypothetical protein